MALFVLLIGCGLLLLIIEMFVPGGIFGVFGGLCLLGAVVVAYTTFDTNNAHAVMIVMLVSSVVGFLLWARYFPQSRLASRLVSRGKSGEPDLSYRELVGATGVAASDLRPAGTVEIDSQRVHVVTRGEFLERGVEVVVIEARGNRVVVRERASA